MESLDTLTAIYEYIAKDYRKPRKEKKIRKCYKCDKIGYLAKNCRLEQKIRTRVYRKNQKMRTKRITIKKCVLSKVQSKHSITNFCT